MREEKEKCVHFRPASGKMWCAYGWCPCVKKEDRNQLCLYYKEEKDDQHDRETVHKS